MYTAENFISCIKSIVGGSTGGFTSDETPCVMNVFLILLHSCLMKAMKGVWSRNSTRNCKIVVEMLEEVIDQRLWNAGFQTGMLIFLLILFSTSMVEVVLYDGWLRK